MSLSSYLAAKYLSADPPPSSSSGKKRKRKSTAQKGLIIADDDALGWSNIPQTPEEEDGRPITVSSGSAEFRKAKKNAWKVVGTPALQPKDDQAGEADKIIAAAAAENSAALNQDEAPTIEDEDTSVVKMGDGTHAGLQSAAAVAKQFEKRKREEASAWAQEGKKGGGAAEETVYRDATGRRIDISMRRQEARRQEDEKARKEREAEEAQKGDVQRAEAALRRERLDEARFMPLARGVDDVEMNEELKERDRWNDPAAQFMVKKDGKGKVGGSKAYMGAAAPNRYGIRPGHKWDGVDRGNGWEGERFKALNRMERNKQLSFDWQMDE